MSVKRRGIERREGERWVYEGLLGILYRSRKPEVAVSSVLLSNDGLRGQARVAVTHSFISLRAHRDFCVGTKKSTRCGLEESIQK